MFEDRTALDMVADFSFRLQACSKHSEVSGGEGGMREDREGKRGRIWVLGE